MAWIENSYVNVQIVLDFADGIFFFQFKKLQKQSNHKKNYEKNFWERQFCILTLTLWRQKK